MHRPFLILSLLLLALLAACAPAVESVATPSAEAEITEYVQATATATLAQATDTFQLPTPTPHLYTVVQNDTLFGIAARFNITLEALMAANPGVNAQALSPGAQLLVPSGVGASTTPVPQITPVTTTVLDPVCYTSAAGELWCLVLVHNDTPQPLENVTGYVRLLDASGAELNTLEAVPPLNLLPPGEAMALVSYLPSVPANWATAQAEIASAFGVQEDASLYVPVLAVDFSWSPGQQNAKAARVVGQASLGTDAASVWVMAVAYDVTDNPVGVRRWESAGASAFDFWVYSLGPDIADVQVVVEAHPAN
ncbi:MAG TPA: LysM peptidoglycan-binding domain-containing protein [Anaerolineales bacterium]|nr:LysM peptidoglycan-binding domain-containing protein [Anaerolineales bacterium]HRQ93343.1 LysM peptidoglycan-binding domain-containing protein [Anaerolineales bacterium]